jgi:hypothetical protein
MRALAKDPDTRYQSCREMLEDLRNYRSLSTTSGNPQSTMAMNSDAVNSTVALSPAQGLRGVHNDDTSAMGRSLSARATHPGQTPALRRTGILQPVPESKPKKSVFGTVFVALLLLGVIGYCANKLRPIYEDVLQQRRAATASSKVVAPTATEPASNIPASAPTNDPSAENSDAGSADPKPNDAVAPVTPPVVDVKSTHVERAPIKKPESVITPKAAEYKGRIEEAISERGLASRAKVQGVGNTLTLSGKLRPAEHGALLKFLRDAPAAIHLIDHIEYDDAPEPSTPSAATANSSTGGHPVPVPGYGAIHVVTDVIGAAAMLHGPSGRLVSQCLTPCSFNNLTPDRYSLEVKKDGYQSIQTALQVKQGTVSDEKLSLESLAKGLYVVSDPPGADVFINGAKQSGQTPVTLPLAAGQYNLVLRLQGYDPYVGSVQVKENVQTQLRTKLNERSLTHVAWAQVTSNPGNAEIFVDGTSTGRFTPARIEVSAGTHTITLKLAGYRPIKRTVSASEGGTVPVNESLSK